MSTKHTPGPWHVEEVSRNQRRVSDATGRRICGNVYEANARLIAAAPDLLAIVRLMADWDCDPTFAAVDDAEPNTPNCQCYGCQARAAIARIDGGRTNG